MSDVANPRKPEGIEGEVIDSGVFPFDAWQMTKPGDAAPILTLKAEWKLETTDLDILGDATITGTLTYGQRPLGHLFGLTLSNGTDATNDIDIAAGEAAASDGTNMVYAGGTKQFDATWAVGTNQGGLFSGSSSADGWYYQFVIMRLDTGAVDFGFDDNATATHIPANYTKYRCVGKLQRSGSAWRPFTQREDRFVWKALVNDRAMAAIPATTRQTQTLTAPPNTVAIVEILAQNSVNTSQFWVRPTIFTDAAASATNRTGACGYGGANLIGIEMEIEVDASSQIAYRGDSTNINLQFETAGYIDTRGRLA